MRISDWSSDVCSSDLAAAPGEPRDRARRIWRRRLPGAGPYLETGQGQLELSGRQGREGISRTLPSQDGGRDPAGEGKWPQRLGLYADRTSTRLNSSH